MGILDALRAATGDPAANARLAEACVARPAMLHGVAEGLRTGTPAERRDCLEVMDAVARERPDLLAPFVPALVETGDDPRRRLARAARALLARLVPATPAAVFAARQRLAAWAAEPGPAGQAAAATLGALAAANPNYRGKLLREALRLFAAVRDADLARRVEALAPVVGNSAESRRRVTSALAPRLAALSPAARRRCERALAPPARRSGGPRRGGRPR